MILLLLIKVILDPELTDGVEKNQWFYTGMDCFIHCVESLNGNFINTFSKSYGEMAYELCHEVFLGNDSFEEMQDKLMMASWHGGMSIAYSQVGVAHAMSYGLSFVLGIKHGVGNCIVFHHLEVYPKDVAIFKSMMKKHNITLPKDVCKSLTQKQMDAMIDVALSLTPLWENAIGNHWKSVITRSKLEALLKNVMIKYISKFIYQKILGWKATGFNDFDSVKKAVIIAVPHTSWHDFYVGLLLRGVLGIHANFIGKKALFNPLTGLAFSEVLVVPQ